MSTTTTTRQERGAARPATSQDARSGRGAASAQAPSWCEPLLELVDAAELLVSRYPAERARVQSVRAALGARFERRPAPPPLDQRDLAFTMGLVATALRGQPLHHGLLLLCLRMLSPSAQAEFERAKGFVRVSPPIRC